MRVGVPSLAQLVVIEHLLDALGPAARVLERVAMETQQRPRAGDRDGGIDPENGVHGPGRLRKPFAEIAPERAAQQVVLRVDEVFREAAAAPLPPATRGKGSPMPGSRNGSRDGGRSCGAAAASGAPDSLSMRTTAAVAEAATSRNRPSAPRSWSCGRADCAAKAMSSRAASPSSKSGTSNAITMTATNAASGASMGFMPRDGRRWDSAMGPLRGVMRD